MLENPAYEERAEEYASGSDANAWNALYERPATTALLPPVAGKRVLDAGCGPGALAAQLAEAAASVVGIDASAAMVRLAEARGLESASFRVADLTKPLDFFEDESFDVAVSSLVLHYLEDWVAPLRELRRVLRPGGALVFSTHHPSWDVGLTASGDYFATELIHDRWWKADRPFDVTFWRRPLTAMVAAIGEAGFRIDTIVEPQPLAECEVRFPEDWAKLTVRPAFLFFRLLRE